MPIGTVVIRRDTSSTGRRICTRYVKVRDDGPNGRRWISYARWWWLKNRGPIPAGKLVLHKDGDVLNDASSNFVLGGHATKLIIAHRDKQWSREQHRRAAEGCAEWNRKKGRINRARNFLKNYWYPVMDDMSVILNIPFGKRKRLLACFGADVSKYPANGHGKNRGSAVQRAIMASRVQPIPSRDLSLHRYSTYCILDPASRSCRGPMAISVDRLIEHLDRMGIWKDAAKQAVRDLRERK
jgi:hypothetical protein